MPATRRFVGAALLICVVAPALPNATRRTPPLAPTAQKRLPSSVAAPLMFCALNVSVIAVDESTTPSPSTRGHDPWHRRGRRPHHAGRPRIGVVSGKAQVAPVRGERERAFRGRRSAHRHSTVGAGDGGRQRDRLHERPRCVVLVEEHSSRAAAERRAPVADPQHDDVARAESGRGRRGRRSQHHRGRGGEGDRENADERAERTCAHGNS